MCKWSKFLFEYFVNSIIWLRNSSKDSKTYYSLFYPFYCKKIIASNDLVCTQTEKDSLKGLDVMFERAVDKLSGAELATLEIFANIIGAEQPLRVTFILFSRHIITPGPTGSRPKH